MELIDVLAARQSQFAAIAAELKKENEELKAKLRQREQQLFGRRSEKNNKSAESQRKTSTKKRGQQKDNPAPKRRLHDNLPTTEEQVELSKADQFCPCCQNPIKKWLTQKIQRSSISLI